MDRPHLYDTWDDTDHWRIKEWPHSRALGERWVAVPPITPADKPWPGIKFFGSRTAAEAFVAEQTG